jgi:hypothetical protein
MSRQKRQEELEHVKAVLQWLRFQPDCMAWRNNQTGAYSQKLGRYIKRPPELSSKGQPDIGGIWITRPLAIEMKLPTNTLTPEQFEFMHRFAEHGGIAIVAKNLDEVIRALQGLRLGKPRSTPASH